ncbi:DNA recombination protein RmuC, partial [Candidatus Saccharibacteria bacterium]|nr:DNA recombination protein RmuC [Candidatus Saccharibacteria bacterium]
MEIYILILLVVTVIGLLIGLVMISQKLRELKSSSAVELMKSDVTELSRNIQGLQQSLGEKVETGNHAMQTNMQKQLSESAKLISDVTKQLTKLDETNRRVVDVADELKTLQTVLQNPKQRGVFGEYYLKSVLENVLPPNNFQMQYKFKNGDIVDAVIFLDKNKILPIDSKFSLENYNRMIAAKNKEEKDRLLTKVK